MSTVSQRAREGRLWDAANSLRGPVDPGDFKAYVGRYVARLPYAADEFGSQER